MKKLLLIFLLVATPVWACDSYKDCMEKGEYQSRNTFDEQMLDSSARGYLKAIAYKLDEISKKLDKDNAADSIVIADDGTACHRNTINFERELYAHSKACMEPKDGSWEKIENAYGKNDSQITWYKVGCYNYREPKK